MKYLIYTAILTVAVISTFAQTPDNGTGLLRQAALYRQPWPDMSFRIKLEDNNITHVYRVFVNDDKALVGYVQPAIEQGNLLLMIKDGLWFYVKETRRPTRITPIQKMSGSVSYGDITDLNWNDYDILSVTTTGPDADGPPAGSHLLRLASRNNSSTYRKVDLWLEKNTARPIMAIAYLLSGKKYKTIRFTQFATVAGKPVNTQLSFTDHFNKDRTSVAAITHIQPEKNIPDRYFIKSSLQELSNEVCR